MRYRTLATLPLLAAGTAACESSLRESTTLRRAVAPVGVVVEPPGGGPSPAAPHGLTAVPGPDGLVISWAAVTGAQLYRLFVVEDRPVDRASDAPAAETGALSHTVTGAKPGGTYYIQAEGVLADGSVTPAASITLRLDLPPPGDPVAPALDAATPTTLTVSWGAADGAAGYRVAYAAKPTVPAERCAPAAGVRTLAAAASPAALAELPIAAEHLIRICALNADGIASKGVLLDASTAAEPTTLQAGTELALLARTEEAVLSATALGTLTSQVTDVSAAVVWQSSDAAVARVVPAAGAAPAKVVGGMPGVATLTAALGDRVASVDVTVSNCKIPGSAAVRKTIVYATQPGADAVAAFDADCLTGALTPIGAAPYPAGTAPRKLVVDPGKRYLYVGNHTTADLTIYAIDQTTGALAEIPGSPVAGSGTLNTLAIHPGGGFLYSGQDWPESIYGFAIGAGGLPASLGAAMGTGCGGNITGSAIHHSGKFAYYTYYWGNAICGRAIDESTGAFTALPGGAAVTGAEHLYHLRFHPSGAFLYAGTGHSAAKIAIATVDGDSGALAWAASSPFTAAASGDTAVFEIDPAGKRLYVQNSGKLLVKTIDAATGALADAAVGPYDEPGTAFMSFDESGAFLYVPTTPNDAISVYRVDPETGALATVEREAGGSASTYHAVLGVRLAP